MSTTPDVAAVARWMAERVERDGYLEQAEAVDLIDERFGEDFTYQNDSGGCRSTNGCSRCSAS
jgi:hypothetical protein